MKIQKIHCYGAAFIGSIMLFGAIGHWGGNTLVGAIFGAGLSAIVIGVVSHQECKE